MILLWSTRGYSWGFTFLSNRTALDPVIAYEQAFFGLEAEKTVFKQLDGACAIKFLDPEGRKDQAGRPIPHELIIDTSNAVQADFDTVKQKVWKLINSHYAAIWKEESPTDFPSP